MWNSEAAGRSENRFTLEWTSKSFSPITQFKLEVAEKGSSNWKYVFFGTCILTVILFRLL